MLLLLFNDLKLFACVFVVFVSELKLILGFVFDKILVLEFEDNLYKILFFCGGEKEVKYIFESLLLVCLDVLFNLFLLLAFLFFNLFDNIFSMQLSMFCFIIICFS